MVAARRAGLAAGARLVCELERLRHGHPGGVSAPVQWLVATSDGEHWVLETFDDIDSENDSIDPTTDTYTFRVAAIHDGVLLVGDALSGGYNGWWLHAF